MASLGTFMKQADGSFAGEIVTLVIRAPNVTIAPEDERPSDDAPTHRVAAGRADIGAGWARISSSNRSYIAVKLDDPSFGAPIYANLVERGDGQTYSLLWSR